jgi:hypothetical protein
MSIETGKKDAIKVVQVESLRSTQYCCHKGNALSFNFLTINQQPTKINWSNTDRRPVLPATPFRCT